MNNQAALVSVLMVSYNSSRFVAEAIKSVLAQSYENFELIIIDDSSSDTSWEIIDSFEDPRMRKFRNERNLKEYPNRNKAIELSSGKYSIFIDADDVIYPHGLEFMMNYATAFSDCGMVISRPWDERVMFPARITPRQFYCLEYLDRGAIGINFTKVLFRSDVLKSVHRFPDSVKFGDLYMQYLIGMCHPSVLIPDASTWWRRTPGQASEALLKNYDQYIKHELWIKLEMLQDLQCPLSSEEKNLASFNLYGNYLRFLAKSLLRLKIGLVFDLLRQYQVPLKYFGAIFRKQRRNYFDRYSGEYPFQ